jgi:hypothetical protein
VASLVELTKMPYFYRFSSRQLELLKEQKIHRSGGRSLSSGRGLEGGFSPPNRSDLVNGLARHLMRTLAQSAE